MNLFEKCVCILFLTVSLGTNGGSACANETSKIIMKCTEPMMRLNHSERTNPDIFCQFSLNASACTLKAMSDCPHFQSLIPKIKREQKFAQDVCDVHKKAVWSLCKAEDILKCTSDIKPISETDKKDFNMLCPKVLDSYACLAEKTFYCPIAARSSARAFDDDGEPLMDQCLDFMLNKKIEDKLKPECTPENMRKCSEDYMRLSSTERFEPDIACTEGIKASNCLLNVLETCLIGYRTQLQLINSTRNFQKALCDFHYQPDPSYTCSVKEILKCGEDMTELSSAERANPRLLCPKLLASQSCMLKSTKDCPKNVTTSFKTYYDFSKQFRKQCGSKED